MQYRIRVVESIETELFFIVLIRVDNTASFSLLRGLWPFTKAIFKPN